MNRMMQATRQGFTKPGFLIAFHDISHPFRRSRSSPYGRRSGQVQYTPQGGCRRTHRYAAGYMGNHPGGHRPHQLPAVLAEVVQDLLRRMDQQRRRHVLPRGHGEFRCIFREAPLEVYNLLNCSAYKLRSTASEQASRPGRRHVVVQKKIQ